MFGKINIVGLVNEFNMSDYKAFIESAGGLAVKYPPIRFPDVEEFARNVRIGLLITQYSLGYFNKI